MTRYLRRWLAEARHLGLGRMIRWTLLERR